MVGTKKGDLCNLGATHEKLAFISDSINEIDVQMRKYPAQYMCTTICPCPYPTNSSTDWLNGWNETVLNLNGRSKFSTNYDFTNSTGAQIGIYRPPLVQNITRMSTFWDCYIALKKVDITKAYFKDVSSGL